MWTEGIIRRRTNGKYKINTNRTNSKWFVSEKIRDALHLWYVVTVLEFVKKPGSLMYRCPISLSVHYYKNEKQGEMKESWGRS
jgi:hypothetical protein